MLYTISQLSKMINIPNGTIRMYADELEEKGYKINRNKERHRLFTDFDVEMFKIIKKIKEEKIVSRQFLMNESLKRFHHKFNKPIDVIKENNPVPIDDLSIKEYKGQRVVTFKDIDEVHGRPEGTASRNFRSNRKRFVENEDFYFIKPLDVLNDEIRRSEINNSGTYLLTESGYLMLVKSFTDDLAWEVQKKLVKTYFRAKQQNQPALPQTYEEALEHLLSSVKRNKELEQQKLLIEEKVTKLEPKAKLADDLLISDSNVSMEVMSKMLGDIGRNTLFEFLRGKSVIQQKPSTLPYQRYVDSKHFEVIQVPRKHKPDIYDPVARVTPKGQEYIHKLWNEAKKDQTLFGKVKKIFKKKKPDAPTSDHQ